MNACHIIFICLQKSAAIAESVHAKDKNAKFVFGLLVLGRGEKNDKENHFFISKYYEKKLKIR